MKVVFLVKLQKYLFFLAIATMSIATSVSLLADKGSDDDSIESQALKEINTKLKINLKKMESLKTELKNRIDEHIKFTKKNTDHIALIYANMDPKKTAQILSDGNITLAAELLKKIPPAKASAILNEIEADTAKKITAKMIQPLDLMQVKCKDIWFIFPDIQCKH